MVSPLGPTLANTFLCHYEKIYLIHTGSYAFDGATFEVCFIMTIPFTGFSVKVTNNCC